MNMTATAHALVGGAIAASIPDPALGLSLAFISHPFIDMIPHWDFGLGWKKKTKITLFTESFFDLGLGIVLAYLFFGSYTDPRYLAAVILFSESWDLLMMPYLLFRWNFFPFSTVYKIQSGFNRNVRLPWGILTQVGTVAILSLFLHTVHF
jgi:hypothetical protein